MVGYKNRHRDGRSDEVYKTPRRTINNGWKKFHADPSHECGSDRVVYIEPSRKSVPGEKYRYDLYCMSCGYKVDERDVLFIGGEWYKENGWQTYGRPVEDLHLQRDRVISLGPQPEEEELREVLNITRIEGEASLIGITFGNETYTECEECEKEALLTFDNRCRMCYEGPWTEEMTKTLNVAEDSIRKSNDSFVHKLQQRVDPLSIHNRAFTDKILWRRSDDEPTPKLVEVVQCLKDDEDGHWEYILSDMNRTEEWIYNQQELANCFWDTGLYNDTEGSPMTEERVRELHQSLVD